MLFWQRGLLEMRVGYWNFTPGIFYTIVTCLVFAVLVSLGLWQLDRAEQKRAHYKAFIERQSGEMLNINDLQTDRLDKQAMQWLPVQATGAFFEEIQFLLDNQVVNTKAGYFVYTPFRLQDTKAWVLVNRGWLPVGPDRSVVPDFKLTTGEVTITGVAKAAPLTGITLRETEPEQMAVGAYRLQKIDLAQLAGFIDKDLLPYVIRLGPDSDHGYLRQWRAPGSGEMTNLGYAFQWFAMAAALLVIYLIVNSKKISI